MAVYFSRLERHANNERVESLVLFVADNFEANLLIIFVHIQKLKTR